MAAMAAVAFSLSPPAASADFESQLARVDEGLKTNPHRVLPQALDSCVARRGYAIQQFNMGDKVRANRSLRSCFQLLKISEAAPVVTVTAPSQEELQAEATLEIDKALTLTPDIDRGLEIYRECAACHMPEGWGLSSGSVPQIAGQHSKVVIKQLADIRSGNRDNVLMAPYSSVESIGGAQAVADVAGYIDTLEVSAATGKGPGKDLTLGERLYRENCSRCHGETGEGKADEFIPRIQSQHYQYLVRQFEWIRDGKRRNANPDMVAQIQSFGDQETHAVLDYVSRLEPPPEIQAPEGWKNPDFVE
jgi:cytochrome c553